MTQQTANASVLPPLADAMTARDLKIHESELRRSLGTKADVHLTCSDYNGSVYLSLSPNGLCSDEGRHIIRGETWPEAILAAQAWIAARPKVERNAIIRKLALAIIELTDENGRCTVAMLRAKRFDEDEIALHAEACLRASEMCANAPFAVEGV